LPLGLTLYFGAEARPRLLDEVPGLPSSEFVNGLLTYGKPVLLRHTNQLPKSGYGNWAYPGSITHLHNFHTASESDGGPWRYTMPGESTDHHYNLQRAGFTAAALAKIPSQYRATDGGGGDVRETLTSLFYHQHMPGYTASNVYRGLVGFCRVFDSMDTGDETRGWRLPGLRYDVPLVFADKRFTPAGQVFFDPFNQDGFLGDLLTVNGVVKPYFEVEPRRYRFRLLSAGPSRFYGVALRAFDDLAGTVNGKDLPFLQVTDNGNLLQLPVTWSNSSTRPLELWVAERSDIVVDFTQLAGKTVYLSNILPMRSDGRGADRGAALLNANDPKNRMLQIRVTKPLGGTDHSDPSKWHSFRPYPTVDMGEVAGRKTWSLERTNGFWVINVDGKGGIPWDPDADHTPELVANPVNKVKQNTAEIWTLKSTSGGWEHPLHIHFEEGMVISQNGVKRTPTSRQDVYRMGSNTIEVFMRFRDYPDASYTIAPPSPEGETPTTTNLAPMKDANKYKINAGRYVMHCHNVVHEDHAMMATWNIVP
jgi:FtsP/CotA-like multicopper oxidase with cupredoxin domain